MVLAIMVAAAAITSLEPTSKWYVDYATDACTVGRAFGPPEKPIVLGIVANAMGHGVDFELVDSRVSGTVEEREFQVQFAPNALPFMVNGRAFPVGPKDVQKLIFHLDDDGMRRLGGSTWIAIDVKRNSLVALDLPGLAPAMAALEKCRHRRPNDPPWDRSVATIRGSWLMRHGSWPSGGSRSLISISSARFDD